MNGWSLFLAALGLAMFLEGLPYFVSPGGVRRYLAAVRRMPDGALRGLGFLLMALGLAVTYLAMR